MPLQKKNQQNKKKTIEKEMRKCRKPIKKHRNVFGMNAYDDYGKSLLCQ